MKIRHPWGKLAVLLSILLAVGIAVPATFAYVVVKSPSIVNTFVASVPSAEEVCVDVKVHKTVLSSGAESIGPAGFHFILEDTLTGAQQTFSTGATGYGSVTLAFSEADAGVHTYRLWEINDKREHVTYSELTYDVVITVALDEAQDVLTAAATVNGESVKAIVAEFENLYTAGSDVPATGDRAPLMGWMLMLLGCGAILLALRRRAVK